MNMTQKRKLKNLMVVVMLCLCTFMGMLLTSARAVILKTLLTELNGIQLYSIVVIITSMMLAAVLPIAGKLSDIIGRKKISLVGIAGYGLASFICATAANVSAFVCGIVLIGISYGVMNAVSSAIICDTFEESVRPRYNSYLTVASAAASLTGPVLGGFAVDHVSWRFVYAITVPIAVSAFLCSFFFLDGKKMKKGVKISFDFAGMISILLCVVPVLFALAAGGNIFPWRHPVIIGCFIAGIVMAGVLFFVEPKQKDPVIPYRLLSSGPYVMCLLVSFFAWYAFAVMNYVTVYYQDVLHVAATLSGILVVPRQVAQIVTSLIAGSILVKSGAFKKLGVGFLIIYGVGMLLMSLFSQGTPLYLVFLAEMCFGIGISGQSVVVNSFVQNTLQPKQAGTGLAFYNFLGSLASSAGAAIGGCIINQTKTQETGLKITFISYFIVIVIALGIAVMSKWKIEKR